MLVDVGKRGKLSLSDIWCEGNLLSRQIRVGTPQKFHSSTPLNEGDYDKGAQELSNGGTQWQHFIYFF